jgi:hypothetical protein
VRTLIDFLLGLFLGLDPSEMTFKRNIKRLRKEEWFKKLSDDARYYENIYLNPVLKDYINKEGTLERIFQNEREKQYFISKITTLKK